MVLKIGLPSGLKRFFLRASLGTGNHQHHQHQQHSRIFFLLEMSVVGISPGTCPRLCSSARNVDCAVSFPLLCDLKQTRVRSFFWGPILNSSLKILIPTKTTRKAATNRFVVSPLVLDCIKGIYAGFIELQLQLNLNFTNVPHAVH